MKNLNFDFESPTLDTTFKQVDRAIDQKKVELWFCEIIIIILLTLMGEIGGVCVMVKLRR